MNQLSVKISFIKSINMKFLRIIPILFLTIGISPLTDPVFAKEPDPN